MASSKIEPGSLPNLDILRDLCNLSSYGNLSSKWTELDSGLKPFDSFHVVDCATEQHLRLARKAGDWNADSYRRGIVSWLATNPTAGPALKRLLQLGLDPDLVSSHLNARPSHWASFHGLHEVADILGVCRPDLTAEGRTNESHGKNTPEGLAWEIGSEKMDAMDQERYIQTAQVWEKFARDGFPTIAQLAAEKMFWAVQNLCRRRVVPEAEKLATFKEKTAIQWAQEHGETELVLELEYFLQPADRTDLVSSLSKRISALELDKNKLEKNFSDKILELSEAVSTVASRMSQRDRDGKDELLGLKQRLLENENRSLENKLDIATLKLAMSEEKNGQLRAEMEQLMKPDHAQK